MQWIQSQRLEEHKFFILTFQKSAWLLLHRVRGIKPLCARLKILSEGHPGLPRAEGGAPTAQSSLQPVLRGPVVHAAR